MKMRDLGYGTKAANEDNISPYAFDEENHLIQEWEESLSMLSKKREEYTSLSEKISSFFLSITESETQYYDFGSISRYGTMWIIQSSDDSQGIIAEIKLGKNARLEVHYNKKKYALDFNEGTILNSAKHTWQQNLWNNSVWRAKVGITRTNDLINSTSINKVKVTSAVTHTQENAKVLFQGAPEERLGKSEEHFKSNFFLSATENGDLSVENKQDHSDGDPDSQDIHIDGKSIGLNLHFFRDVQVDSGEHLHHTGISLLNSFLEPLGEKEEGPSLTISQILCGMEASKEIQDILDT